MDVVLQKLGEQGLLGILLAIAIYAIFRIFNLYIVTQEKRIAENREQIDVIRSNTLSNDNNTAAIKELGDLVRSKGRRP